MQDRYDRQRDQSRHAGAQIGWQIPVIPESVEALPQKISQRPKGQICVDEEAQEVRERRHGDAVPRPGTMMVHFRDASLAKAAVMGPRRLRGLALLAPFFGVHLNHLLREDISAGVDGYSFEIVVVEDGEEGVEDDGFCARGRAGIECCRDVEHVLGEESEERNQQAHRGNCNALDERRIAKSHHVGARQATFL